MTIEPDTKDWTWVLEQECPECGFDTTAVTGRDVPGILRENLAGWQRTLAEAADPALRPAPGTWSTLEYACHVRDVFVLFRERLGWMLTQDNPLFANWDQDATAVQERYAEQDPGDVSKDLAEAGAALATAFEQVPDDAWERAGRRGDGAHFTIDSFARYFIHDPVHHLHDVTPR